MRIQSIEPEYKLEGNQYIFCMDGEIRFMSSEIAIAYARWDDNVVLLKHGRPEFIELYVSENFQQYRLLGEELCMISGKFPIEELNKVIQITGYLAEFLKMQEASCRSET